VAERWNLLVRNPHYKLLSIALAIMAWAWVQLERVTDGPVRAAVDWQLPSGLMSLEPLPASVLLNVRGTGAAVRQAQSASVRLPVDLSGVGVGSQHVQFDAFHPVGLPDAVELLDVATSSIDLTLDEVARRKVKLSPVAVGDPAVGRLVQGVEMEPAVLEIVGPRGVIETVMAVKTRPFDITGLASDASVPVELDLPRSVRPAEGVVPMANVHIVPKLERRVLSTVQLKVWNQEGWDVQPSHVEVTLEGPANALESILPIDVVGFVHVPDVPERSRYEAPWGPREGLRLRVLVSGGDAIEVVRVEPSRVEALRR
jgi:YbbR domain-containing protein